MKNEFGDEISEAQIQGFILRIRRLEDEEIDKLWHETGFMIENHPEDLKALRRKDIRNIRKDNDSAKTVIENLLYETPIEDFKEELRKIEN